MWWAWALGFGLFLVVGIPVICTAMYICRGRQARQWGDSTARDPDSSLAPLYTQNLSAWWRKVYGTYPSRFDRPADKPYDPSKG